MNIDQTIIKDIIEVVVLVIVTVVARYVIPAIKSKLGTTKLAEITAWAETFVKYAEQIFAPNTGEEKLAIVTKLLSEKASEIGIDLSAEDIRALIEKAVYIMNNETSKEEITVDKTTDTTETTEA